MEAESETRKLHALRLSLLSAALDALPSLRYLPGVRAIPFVQVRNLLARLPIYVKELDTFMVRRRSVRHLLCKLELLFTEKKMAMYGFSL